MKWVPRYEAVFVNGEWVVRNKWAWKHVELMLHTTGKRVQERAAEIDRQKAKAFDKEQRAAKKETA